MANEDLGVKRDCPECGARFYDLSKDPALCPKCQHEFTPEVILKPRRTRKDEEAETQKDGEEAETEDDDEQEDASERETSLDEAEAENKSPASKRKGGLDDDENDEDDDDEVIPEIEGIEDVDIDADDDTLLDDDDDDDVPLVPAKGNDDD